MVAMAVRPLPYPTLREQNHYHPLSIIWQQLDFSHRAHSINLKKIKIMDVDQLIGSIFLFPYNFSPSGWMPCNGQILNINQYSALYSLIGATYGGNGSTTFGLPNLNGAQPLSSMQYCIAVTGIYPSRP
jgi:microcystin-dependent protein